MTDSFYPPTGTYPSPAEAPVVSGQQPEQPQPQQAPKKSRRVGVYTMALCLIAAGVVLVLAVFLPNLNYIFIARLFPLALVFLGIELLVSAMRHREDKLRIDFLTIFICLVLIGGSVVAAVLPQVYRWEVEGHQLSNRIEAELEEASFTALSTAGAPKVSELEWYVSLEGRDIASDMSAADIRPEQGVQFRMLLLGEYANAAAFAQDCRAALKLLRPLAPHIDYVSFYSASPGSSNPNSQSPEYTLWLNGPYQIDDESLPLENYVEELIVQEGDLEVYT